MARKKAAEVLTCRPVVLPEELTIAAARTAIEMNPANRPPVEALAAVLTALVGDPSPSHLAVLTSKYWGSGGVKLGVKFLDTSDATLKNKILAHMNVWGERANVKFAESAQGQVRVARAPGDGYWSYLGTDVLSIPASQPTMNLDSFSLSTAESEYRRVVPHETGHTLGFPHEHMRRALIDLLDPAKTVAYFQRTYRWDAETTRQQVLTPLEESSIMGTPGAEASSIMCYQLPGACTKSGAPIPGGGDLSELDRTFSAKLYPPAAPPPPPPPPAGWSNEVRVRVAVAAAVEALEQAGYRVTRP